MSRTETFLQPSRHILYSSPMNGHSSTTDAHSSTADGRSPTMNTECLVRLIFMGQAQWIFQGKDSHFPSGIREPFLRLMVSGLRKAEACVNAALCGNSARKITFWRPVTMLFSFFFVSLQRKVTQEQANNI